MLNSIKFYNGTSGRFQQVFSYTKPDTDFKEEYGNAYYNVDAPPKTLFTVPFELDTGDGGVWRLGIHREITDRFGARGIIRVDANIADALKDNVDDPRYLYFALNDDKAKEKGDNLWKLYLRRIIEDFEHDNQKRVTERALAPLRPNNFVAHAYKELGMMPPGDEKFVNAGLQQTEVTKLQEAFAKQQETINVLMERLEKQAPPDKPAEAAAAAKSKGHKEKETAAV
jgi:hypothetical protein